MTHALTHALEWAGIEPTATLLDQLATYRQWLTSEATTAGGIGPDERERIDSRHLADSLLFAGVWDGDPGPVLDVGTGVGLPGVPLALALPQRRFVLLDRSGRRIRLLRRAVRILELSNVDVLEEDILGFDWSGHTVISRASLPPGRFLELVEVKGRPRELLVSGSQMARPEAPGFEVIEIPSEILARPVWILRMAQ